jgi:hypothetical protein
MIGVLYYRGMTTELKATSAGHRTAQGCGQVSGRQLVWLIVFGLTWVAGSILLQRFTLPTAIQYLIAAIPVIAGGIYINALVCDIRRKRDELQLRIYLEAAAVVVCGLFLLMFTYPLLQAVHLVGPLDSGRVLVFMAVLLAVAYFRAVRRYR